MADQETSRNRDRYDSVLRTFALLIGGAMILLALAVLANGLFLRLAGPSFALLSAQGVGCLLALGVGAFSVYWGIQSSKKKVSERSLSRLVRRYEREGKAKEAEDAREQLIELLIEKDERK